jgi:hypothetical protein
MPGPGEFFASLGKVESAVFPGNIELEGGVKLAENIIQDNFNISPVTVGRVGTLATKASGGLNLVQTPNHIYTLYNHSTVYVAGPYSNGYGLELDQAGGTGRELTAGNELFGRVVYKPSEISSFYTESTIYCGNPTVSLTPNKSYFLYGLRTALGSFYVDNTNYDEFFTILCDYGSLYLWYHIYGGEPIKIDLQETVENGEIIKFGIYCEDSYITFKINDRIVHEKVYLGDVGRTRHLASYLKFNHNTDEPMGVNINYFESGIIRRD